MRRRAFLAVFGAAAVAGCNEDDEPVGGIGHETATPAPVPTAEPTPESGPPADVSALGVEDASELGKRHRETLGGGPHGFVRDTRVFQDDRLIRRVEVTLRAAPEADRYYFRFDADDTDRYPTRPADPYFETWDHDGTTYFRYGEDDADAEFVVSDNSDFDSSRNRTTGQYRVRRLFAAFMDADIDGENGRKGVSASGLRADEDVTPPRIRVVEQLRSAEMNGTVRLDPTWVSEYDLSLVCSISGRRADIESFVTFERPDVPVSEPDWIQRAIDQQ